MNKGMCILFSGAWLVFGIVMMFGLVGEANFTNGLIAMGISAVWSAPVLNS